MEEKIPNCISVANRIIRRTNAHNEWRTLELGLPRIKLTGRRLQKIMYLCQLFWYIKHEESNMIPEDFHAWPTGPIISEIYDYWLSYQDGDMITVPYAKYKLSKEEENAINIVVDNTIDIPTEAIIDYTQIDNGPWAQAYKNYQGVNSIISKNSIKQYIRTDEAQRELINFIKNASVTYEETESTKKRILQKMILYK